MFNQVGGKVTYVPSLGRRSDGYSSKKEKKSASVLESLYWQTLGWVHTPPFMTAKLDSDLKFKIPKSSVESDKYAFYTKKSIAPKLQIEDKVPYGVLPRDVASDIEKRRFAQQDFKAILDAMGIEKEAILPTVLFYKDGIEILEKSYSEGIPTQPFLDLALFDDAWFYDVYSPAEWLSLGNTGKDRKPLPAIAFIPGEKQGTTGCIVFDWYKVIVLDYDAEKKLFFVKRDLDCRDDDNDSTRDTSNSVAIWIPRIYLKFDAEEPFQFARRLQNALYTRHITEESLRMKYYIECMPLENSPEWSKEDLDSIIEIVRRSRTLQTRLQWIKDHLAKNMDELQLEYKRAYNSICYIEIAKQNPCLIKDFKSESLFKHETNELFSRSKVQMNLSFADKFESFRCKTFYTCVEAIRALNLVETNILALRDVSLYSVPLNDIQALEKFENQQRSELLKTFRYVHDTWMSEISDAIQRNLEGCGKGPYDLNQTRLHTFKLTKLGKLLKLVTFKMQDVIRFLVMESLEKYAETFQTACSTVMDVKDSYKWTESLCSNQFSTLVNPVFEVPLEIKGTELKFGVKLRKYEDTVMDLFEEGLRVTKDLPRIEKFVMKKMLYNPDDKLDTISESEKQVVRWKMDINRGMKRAVIAATAYIRAYDVTLKSFKLDQISYTKQLISKKVTCDQLKEVIEKHNTEKKCLEDKIPCFIDIGPFRLVTKSVREAAIKKHEQLADVALNYFHTKLRQCMEHINNQFLMLIDRVEQQTGNIEDLLDKKQWCRTVPKRIENICVEVNQLRSDVKLISTFHHNLEDEDFLTFWQVQKLPQEAMRRLYSRISEFEAEKEKHKEHLRSDQEKLEKNLKIMRSTISKFMECSDLAQTTALATEIRIARKGLTKYDEQSLLYQKRERLFGIPETEYEEIAELGESLAPYEKFWLSAAEFNKYEERDDEDLLSIDPVHLRATIEEFRSQIEESLEFFTEESHPEINECIVTVLEDVETFIENRIH